MKSVLISIQPYWVFLIIAKKMGWNVDKEKTIEVRKNYPKDENWNKAAKIYCSKDKKSFYEIPKEYHPLMEQFLGKVIAEFICNQIDTYDDDTIYAFSTEDYSKWNDFELYNSCIHPEDLEHYANDNWLYGWHISDLVIYDKPRELSEFYQKCEATKCEGCDHLKYQGVNSNEYDYDCEYAGYCIPITKPPQSWCYVEEVHNG